MNIIKIPSKSISHGGKRSKSAIRYLVFHYTGNPDDTARGNGNYFSPNGDNRRYAGAHYFVDENNIVQSIDDLLVAWAVGGSKYGNTASTGGGSMYGKITNYNSISIEMCSNNRVITAKTIANAVALGKMLMKKYNIPIERVFRHFDVTGKDCPGWYGWNGKGTSQKWEALKKQLAGKTNTQKTFESYKVRIIAEELNVRKEASAKSDIVTTVRKNQVFTIVKESEGGNWGKLKSGSGWIALKYTKKV